MAELEGMRLGTCRVLRRIGGGGMGEVYIAEHYHQYISVDPLPITRVNPLLSLTVDGVVTIAFWCARWRRTRPCASRRCWIPGGCGTPRWTQRRL